MLLFLFESICFDILEAIENILRLKNTYYIRMSKIKNLSCIFDLIIVNLTIEIRIIMCARID